VISIIDFSYFDEIYFPIQYLKGLVFIIVAEDWATNSQQKGCNKDKYKAKISKIS